jgi:chemotaxis signal transduction protein
MEGPLDPQHPGQDAGASQPEAQDDLHALLERLLGQGDVRPSAPGAGDELWPDLAASPAADEVSTIVPAPDPPAAVPDLASALEATLAGADAEGGVELTPARAWEPVVLDPAATTTNVDDIHAAILASVSVELEPMLPAAAEASPETETDAAPELDLSRFLTLASEQPAAADAFDVEPPSLDALLELALPPEPLAMDVADHVEPAAAVDDEPAAAAFTLTPFEAAEGDAAADVQADAEALWSAYVPELGIDIAPLLDLDAVEDAGLDAMEPAGLDATDASELEAIDVDVPAPISAVVLPWPSHEPKAAEPAAPPQDLIEAALSGLHADLTSEPVEPLRTPDVAVATAHVVFRLGSRTMAIPLAAVSEIARPPKVTRLPHVPAWVLGIANLRGDIVSMLDLEGFLSGKVGKPSHEQRMLALRPAGDEVRTAVLVDSVDGIQAFEDARISRVTRGYDAAVAPYARGLYQLEDDLVVVLDADRLLQSKPMRQFEDGAGAR